MTLAEPTASGGRPVERVPVVRVRDGAARGTSDVVAAEEPLEIRLDGEQVAVTMRTPAPGEDAELALGFLLGEAIVSMADVARVVECRAGAQDGGIADVRLRPGAHAAAGWQRRFYSTSSCGICGKQSIEAVRVAAAPLRGRAAGRVRDARRPARAAASAAAHLRAHGRAARRRPLHRGRQAARCCARTSAATTPSTR